MKKTCILLSVLVVMVSISYGVVGDVYDLGNALRHSVDPVTVANSTNPYTDPNNGGVWSFTDGGGIIFPNPITNPSTQLNGELPTSGHGWGGNHISLSVFDANDGANTNYLVGGIGGHAPIRATFKTPVGGVFRVESLAYNARLGAATQLLSHILSTSVGGEVYNSGTFSPDDYRGVENALIAPPFITQLPADGTVAVEMQGNDWSGMTLTLTEIADVNVLLTISTDPACETGVTPYSNDTQEQGIADVISITAPPFTECGGSPLMFDHWEVVLGDVVIANATALSTTVQFSDAVNAEIKAVYANNPGASEDIGDVYDLGDALWASVDPVTVANSTNPYTDGSKVEWTFADTAGSPFPTPITAPNTQLNPELPTSGRGWGGNHISLSVFDANDGSNTNYQIGDSGGHSPIKGIFKTLKGGAFRIDSSIFNARTVAHPAGDQPIGLSLATSSSGEVYDSGTFGQFDYNGSANALVAPSFVTLLPPDGTVTAATSGNDWTGLTLTLTKLNPGNIDLTISTNPATVNTVLPYSNDTQAQTVASIITLEAETTVTNCPDVLEFDHWEIISGNIVVADVDAPVTTLSFTDGGGAAEVQAVYNDVSYCGDACHPIILADITGPSGVSDCIVDLYDFAEMASVWLNDNRP